ncbi:MAG: tetratricopeptide repeat protein [Candidatus Kariarchaeaceae archaeon]
MIIDSIIHHNDSISKYEKYQFIDDLIETGDFQKAKEAIHNELKEKKPDNVRYFIKILEYKIARLRGDFKFAIISLSALRNKINELDDNFLSLYVHVELLWVERLNGQNEDSLKNIEYSEQLLEVLEKSEDKYTTDMTLVFKANIAHVKAVIIMEQGNIAFALSIAYESLSYRETIGKINGIADSLNNIGVMHWYKGELENAVEQFNQCLTLRKEIGNVRLTALVLLNLVQLNVQIGSSNIELAKKYLDEFEEITIKDVTNNQHAQNFYKFARAVYLKGSNRFKNRVQAEELFYELIQGDQLDVQHLFFAYYYLAELLLFELKTTGNDEVLEEINVLIESMTELGEEKKMNVVISRSHLLHSKLKIIEGRITEAKKCLNIALNLALEANDNRLLYTVTKEFDKLFEDEEKLQQIDPDTSLDARIEVANIEEVVTQFVDRSIITEDVETETPILFMIMSQYGTLIYSKSFGTEDHLDENLISNFLSAINDFGNQIFASSGNIERINHQDYTILMKSEENIIFNYVFKGSSYSPSIKLNEITNKIMNLNYFKDREIESNVSIVSKNLKVQIGSLLQDVIA